MKTSFTTILTLLILISSCTTHSVNNPNKYVLKGEISGQDSGIITLFYFHNNTRIQDTAKIENGKFIFTGEILEPTQALLNSRNDSDRVFIYIEPGKMEISVSKGKFEECKMTGSKTQAQSDLLNKTEKPFSERLTMLRAQRNTINNSIINSKSDSSKLLLEKKVQEIDINWSQTVKQKESIEIKFVLENPTSFLAVIKLRSLDSRDALSLDSLKAIFNGLDNPLKESSYGKDIIEDIRKKENIRIGAQPPDFKATDLNHQTLTLSQFMGKSVVLLDFWASWCVPCRESLPHLKTVYNKYHSKGFDIIAVSTDESRNEWIEAVKQVGTEMWHHILIAEKWPNGQITNDDIYQNYPNTSIPEQILIDKDGRIIYHHLGYSKESEKVLDSLLFDLFEK